MSNYLGKDRWNKKGDLAYHGSVCVGEILTGDDGFYIFYPNDKGNRGFWSEYMLFGLGELLREINEPWQKQIDRDPRINKDIKGELNAVR